MAVDASNLSPTPSKEPSKPLVIVANSKDPIVVVPKQDEPSVSKQEKPSVKQEKKYESKKTSVSSVSKKLAKSASKEGVNSKLTSKSIPKKPEKKDLIEPEYPILPFAPNLPPINPFNAQHWPNNGIVPFISKSNFISKQPISRTIGSKKAPILIDNEPNDATRKEILHNCPFIFHQERPLVSKLRVQQNILAVPERLTVAEMGMVPRNTARQYYGYGVILYPMGALIRADDEQCCDFFYEVTAREAVIVKIVIENPSNFRIKPKLVALKGGETGKFTLYYEAKKPMLYPYAGLTFVFVYKTKYDEFLKNNPTATMKDMEHDGIITIPILVEKYVKYDSEMQQKLMEERHGEEPESPAKSDKKAVDAPEKKPTEQKRGNKTSTLHSNVGTKESHVEAKPLIAEPDKPKRKPSTSISRHTESKNSEKKLSAKKESENTQQEDGFPKNTKTSNTIKINDVPGVLASNDSL